MNRKEWLETFLRLAHEGAPAVDYRKHLRIMNRDLRRHVEKIGEYSQELAALNEAEQGVEHRGESQEQNTGQPGSASIDAAEWQRRTDEVQDEDD